MNATVDSPWRNLNEMAEILGVEPLVLRRMARKKLAVHYRISERIFQFSMKDLPELQWQVTHLSHRVMPKRTAPPTIGELLENLQSHRYVYFIRPVGGGPIKIGNTDKLDARFKTIQACCPVRLELLAYAHGGHLLEKALHRKFRKSRLHGEWFRATPNLKKLISLLARECQAC
jgi:hypothetical protein